MPRIKIELPETFSYTTEMDVRITDINYGQHMGNNTLLAFLHEARIRCLAEHQLSEIDKDGMGFIMADMEVAFKSETFYGAHRAIDIAVNNFSKRGCDFLYRVRNLDTSEDVAHARTGIIFFD
jgi:acyl-CoA thioesterase FadM